MSAAGCRKVENGARYRGERKQRRGILFFVFLSFLRPFGLSFANRARSRMSKSRFSASSSCFLRSVVYRVVPQPNYLLVFPWLLLWNATRESFDQYRRGDKARHGLDPRQCRLRSSLRQYQRVLRRLITKRDASRRRRKAGRVCHFAAALQSRRASACLPLGAGRSADDLLTMT